MGLDDVLWGLEVSGDQSEAKDDIGSTELTASVEEDLK